MEKIKLALLGCGDVAQRDYLPEFHRLADRVELVAVCGRTEARARQVGEQFGAKVYTAFGRMFVETEAEAVINLTPIQLHAETTLAALQAGKHVYTEKPAASTVSEVKRIRTEAQQRGLALVCAPCVMLFPQVRYVHSMLAENVIGAVHSARGSGHGGVPPWIGYTSDPSPFFTAGGGPALDMGVYPLHALTGLLGPAKRVMAMAAKAQESFVVADGPAQGKEIKIEADDNWHLILDFGNSRLASVDANNVAQGTRAPQLELFGLNGTVAINLLDVSAPAEVLRPGADWERISLPRTGREAGPDHLLGVEHLVDCLQHNQKPKLSVDHALHVIEIIEKAALSAATGRAFDIENTF